MLHPFYSLETVIAGVTRGTNTLPTGTRSPARTTMVARGPVENSIKTMSIVTQINIINDNIIGKLN